MCSAAGSDDRTRYSGRVSPARGVLLLLRRHCHCFQARPRQDARHARWCLDSDRWTSWDCALSDAPDAVAETVPVALAAARPLPPGPPLPGQLP